MISDFRLQSKRGGGTRQTLVMGWLLVALWSSLTYADPFYAWHYEAQIKFSGYAGGEVLTNFPVLVVLNTNIANFSYSRFSDPAAGGDLRFCDGNYTVLNYEIEQWNTNGDSTVWVQVPLIANSNDFIRMYMGGPDTNPPACTTNGSTWSQRYRGVWHMGDSNAMDSTSSRFNGAGYGNTNVAGRIGQGQGFDGNDYIGMGSGTNPVLGLTAFSFSWWMCETSHMEGAQISSDSNVGVSRFIIQDNYAQNFQPVYANGRVFTNANYLVDGQWHHYSLTVDNVSGGMWAFYVDGLLKDSMPWTFVMSNYELQFGKHVNMYFSGGLDEIQLSSVARSADWVRACYMNQSSNNVFSSYSQLVCRGTVIMIR